jgi:chemotaxis signal transduction protein
MHLRGSPLPVCDLRTGAGEGAGDVVLMAMADGSLLGVAVDNVVAVVSRDALTEDDEGVVPTGLPLYVVGVLRRADRPEEPVFLVAMSRLVESLVAQRAAAAV